MHVDEQQILSISRELWATQLGLNLTPISDAEPHAGVDRTLSSCVRVSGTWQGTILLECPESIARHAAAMLYAADGAEASDEEIRAALGEVAEMIAKKMRPLLPEATKLSRPAVLADGASPCGPKSLSEIRLSCEGRPVRIAVFENEPEPATAA
jgi:hypothetical protein